MSVSISLASDITEAGRWYIFAATRTDRSSPGLWISLFQVLWFSLRSFHLGPFRLTTDPFQVSALLWIYDVVRFLKVGPMRVFIFFIETLERITVGRLSPSLG